MLFFRYRAVNVCPVSSALGGLYFDWCRVRDRVSRSCARARMRLESLPRDGQRFRAERTLVVQIDVQSADQFLFTKPAHPGTAVVTLCNVMTMYSPAVKIRRAESGGAVSGWNP
jgi:hypothetical protein